MPIVDQWVTEAQCEVAFWPCANARSGLHEVVKGSQKATV